MKKNTLKKKVLLVSVVSLFALNISAFVFMNDLNCVYSPLPEKALIESNVVDGALHFLQSKSFADLLLYEYEKSAKQPFSYYVAFNYTKKAIIALEKSRVYYSKVLEIGEKLGYVERKIEWFKTFNYDKFIESHGLNRGIAKTVKSYLSRCDVNGLHRANIDNIERILTTLYYIKRQIKRGITPNINVFWTLSQQYSETMLFGNYATMMGMATLRLDVEDQEKCEK
jgi:hypothetical protein